MTELTITLSDWRRASACHANYQCVEVAATPTGAAVRDAGDPGGPVLSYHSVAWAAFLDALRGA